MKFAATPISAIDSPARTRARSVLARGAGHRQHVVERHRDVGDHDLPGGLREGLARRRPPPRSTPPRGPRRWARAVRATSSSKPRRAGCRRRAAVRPSPAARPQRWRRRYSARWRRRCRRGSPGPLVLRQARRGEPDDDGVVAGEHQVDHDDLEEGGDRRSGEKVGEHVDHEEAPCGSISPTSQPGVTARGARPDNGKMASECRLDKSKARNVKFQIFRTKNHNPGRRARLDL